MKLDLCSFIQEHILLAELGIMHRIYMMAINDYGTADIDELKKIGAPTSATRFMEVYADVCKALEKTEE